MTPTQFQNFIQTLSAEFTSVIDRSYHAKDYVPIDLSSANADLKAIDVSSSEAFEVYIANYLKTKSKKVAYGGYLEKRDIYNRSKHFNQQDKLTERNIHLGLDVWVASGTPVLAALDGVVHSFKNNTNYGDYGPTIILKHTIEDVTFYTLYGHLNKQALNNLEIGQSIRKGEELAVLGTAKVNGDYAPHLHFQVIRDLESCVGDYPGVCSKLTLKHYESNCPNPNLLLKLQPF